VDLWRENKGACHYDDDTGRMAETDETHQGEEVKGVSNKEGKAADIVLYFLRHRVWNEVRLVILVWRGNIEERGEFLISHYLLE